MIVLWSGGVDSTWMLYSTLNTTPVGVRTLSIHHPQVAGSRQGLTARNKIYKLLRQVGWNFARIEIEVAIKAAAQDHATHNGIIQPLMWIQFALLHAVDGETIRVGYVKGDDALRQVDKIQYITEYAGSIMGKKLNLEFPLAYSEKANVTKALQGQQGLFDATWWCEHENPNARKPCGKCSSCWRHQTVLWQIGQGYY